MTAGSVAAGPRSSPSPCALHARPDSRHEYVFTATRGNRNHPSRMQRIWSSILKRTGITREGVSLNTLRHSAATLVLQSGRCDALQIAEAGCEVRGRLPRADQQIAEAERAAGLAEEPH